MSIVIVTFFGLQPAVDQFKVYMSSISITSYDGISGGEKYISIKYDEIEGMSSVMVEYEYSPDNASNPESVKFSLLGNTITIGGETKVFATVNNFGEVVFLSKGTVKLTIRTTDGSKLSDSVLIICR